MLEILYHDEYLIAINKPSGLLVHKSFYSGEANTYAIQELKKQIGQKVYPVHRLDRKTSGVLLFTLDKDTLRLMSTQFAKKAVEKKYIAILRGWAREDETIDYDLVNENEVKQNALTHYRRLQTSEINLPFLKHQTSRYCLVEAFPQTGRFHQLRKHFKHILHPILGCRKHGCNKQNKLWLETFGITKMTLHAHQLNFTHPVNREKISLNATIDEDFKSVGDILNFDLSDFL
ncbi:pseudouridylate synthase [Chryseobacterium sp. Leaf180]|uniref:pseudouridine synthase n=1 Tax=Chryseobacterium sp. Leaf180 TaxID=1736289 RepID=UPI0006F701E6|nr:pseudouridine synthase [Chryseobacterium sp. Leaf180]KQR95399.1 pseudouridylate synthase [Chryseobacterium sp. Leaf180]